MKDKEKKEINTFDDYLMTYLTDDEKILNKETDIAKDAMLFSGKDIKGYYEDKNSEYPIKENSNGLYESEEENSDNVDEKNDFSDKEEDVFTDKYNDENKNIKDSNRSQNVKGGSNDMLPNLVLTLIFLFSLALVWIKGVKSFMGFESILVFVIWLSILSYFSIIIHEGGHLIFGLLSGYKFASFRIGNIMFIKNSGKITYKKYHVQGTGGQCLMIPPDVKGDKYDFPYFLYSLGGVILNLLFGFVCLVFYIVLPYIVVLSEGLIAGFALSLYFGLLNGIPRKIGGIANDGANAIYLDEDINSKKAFYSQLKINGLLTKGVRLRDMQESLFDVDEKADYLNPLVSAMVTLKCNYLIDKREFEKARELIEYSLDNLTDMLSVHRSELECELFFIELISGSDREVINKMYNEDLKRYIETTKRYYLSRRRQLYAYDMLYLEDEKKARDEINAFEAMGRTYPYEVEIEGEIELFHLVHDKAVQRGVVEDKDRSGE